MAQVYEEAMQKSSGATLSGINELSLYMRTAENETNNLFPTLQNPQLVMYVSPHLAGQEEAPIPGYSTAFPLFERECGALPGEVESLRY